MWAGSNENQGNFLSRISIRRNQVASMEGELEDLDLFQKTISEKFSEFLHPSLKIEHPPLPSAPTSSPVHRGGDSGGGRSGDGANESLLSIAWLRKFVDAFLCCESEFNSVVLGGREGAKSSNLDRWIPDLLDREVKGLDICNGVTHGIDAVGFMLSQAQIVVNALGHRPFTEGQIRRARRALGALQSSIAMDEKEPNKFTERSWSFGRRSSVGSSKNRHSTPNFKSLSWSVAKNWSAAKQVQLISSNLNPPRGGESTGLTLTVYIMNVVLGFVMWVLVAAVPCQDRVGLGSHISIPKHLSWAQGLSEIHDKISEEWKRKEKKGSTGLMEEVVNVEKLAQSLVDYVDNFQYPMDEDKEAELAVEVEELAEVCKKMEVGLGPLRVQIRELFHRLVKSRGVMLDVLEQVGQVSNS